MRSELSFSPLPVFSSDGGDFKTFLVTNVCVHITGGKNTVHQAYSLPTQGQESTLPVKIYILKGKKRKKEEFVPSC